MIDQSFTPKTIDVVEVSIVGREGSTIQQNISQALMVGVAENVTVNLTMEEKVLRFRPIDIINYIEKFCQVGQDNKKDAD